MRHTALAAALALAHLLVFAGAAPLAAADGALDPSFNGGGGAAIPVGNWSRAWAVAVQPDGKVLIAGEAEVPSGGDSYNTAFAIARRNANGTPDATFGPVANGTVTVDFDLGPPGLRQ